MGTSVSPASRDPMTDNSMAKNTIPTPTKVVILGGDAFLAAAKSLVKQGDLTTEQYAGMVRRANAMPEKARQNTVIFKEAK